MDIQEFENKIYVGAKVKIERTHRYNGHGKQFEDGIWTFYGYSECSTKCLGVSCSGNCILMNENGLVEECCYRNSEYKNIRLVLIENTVLPDNLFEI